MIDLKSLLKSLCLVLGASVLLTGTAARAETVIKISHQFPAASDESGDFRDRLARKFAAEVEKRTKGELKFQIFRAARWSRPRPSSRRCARVRST